MIGQVAIDTNLLVLLVVGITSRAYLSVHKRVNIYDGEHLDKLLGLIADRNVILTPNTLSETSNILKGVRDPSIQAEIDQTFKQLIQTQLEVYIPSVEAVSRTEFQRLGVADCVMLLLAAEGATLLSTDLQLCLAAEKARYKVVNFNHVIDRY